ncbi:type III PLP-dependent enzyme [Limobrevibacterium gyesilva]|uniref:ornithine decarboxylase n=1 Tax=Limobrevibacterium gyesilva TaxID=2991712 RepID=A0AA41YNT1_9PROT|nr:type III PLP-dependent enzyme [Limobrevibacterium gyesilva]MCW3475777.1 type III PLP-dependent enzyme [Limobrevibacterium gyesilva]
MSQLRSRAAVSPLRRALEVAAALPTVDALVAVERPAEPMHCLRPATVAAAAARFVAAFPGDVLYAVKCNPEPAVLRALWEGGVRHFDCASAGEVALVRQMFPDAGIHFMHPVKARPAIRDAYACHGVRDFVLDSADELAKILAETGGTDLGLVVRLALPAGGAMYDLSGKFGASLEEAAALLRAARPHAARLGVSFHVGSQCLDPVAYRQALQRVGAAIRLAGVPVEVVDVGGGFPVSYPDITPPSLGAYLAEIGAAFDALGLPVGTRLWAEPGRALVAAGTSVVVQVQLRRGDALYVNDGVYGSLSDAGAPGFRFPVRLIRPDGAAVADKVGFELFGPTCDSADRMRGPFLLPADMREGDWIEIGQLGAYGACLRTAFNGFDRARIVEVRDAPLLATPGYEADEVALAA